MGEQPTLEEFCSDPSLCHLLPELKSRVRILESMSWLDEPLADSDPKDPSQSLDSALQNSVLGNYLLMEPIGAGGMGQVFRAVHCHMKRQVAIKVLPQESVDSPAAVARFRHEIEVLAALEHPNVVTAFDADEFRGRYFLVMQFVEGTDVSGLVRRHGPFTVPQALSVLLQVASGLGYVHSKGVVHRDIKPSNLMIETSGVVKILDLGLALFEPMNPTGSERSSQHGEAMGTIDYMAPEQMQQGVPVDPRSDMYSLGCTLYFMLTGRAVYGGQTPLERYRNHLEAPVPDLRELRSDVPACVGNLFRRMVAKRREDRIASMAELRDEIERCAAECHLNISLPPYSESFSEKRPPAVQRRWMRNPFGFPLSSVTAVVAGLSITAIVGWWMLVAKAPVDLPTPSVSPKTSVSGNSVSRIADSPSDRPETSSALIGSEADREIAQWARQFQGVLEVFIGEDYLQLRPALSLPPGPLRIQAIEFQEGRHAVVTAADIRRLQELKSLITLGLYDAHVSPDAWQELPRLSKLQQLGLGRTAITDDDLQYVARMELVHHLRLGETSITDAGLKHLSRMKSLTSLDLRVTKVTPDGIRSLRQSLPQCRVERSP